VTTPFDYDRSGIARVYDRGRDHGPGVAALWMDAVEAAVRGRGPTSIILDLGCGTGRFTGALQARFGAHVIAIDPSREMLAEARAKGLDGRVRYEVGRAEDIRLENDAVDLVFMSMVFHHLADPARAAAECRRVLRPGGVAFLRAGTADRIQAYPYVPFFPTTVPLLHEILPPAATMRGTFEGAGFETIREGLLIQEISPTTAGYADKLAAGGDSVLARLSPQEMEGGLARLREHARRVDPEPVSEPIDTFAFG
jgi:ubiquinone/menaquinone biosynthesis C-methylase UbiE